MKVTKIVPFGKISCLSGFGHFLTNHFLILILNLSEERHDGYEADAIDQTQKCFKNHLSAINFYVKYNFPQVSHFNSSGSMLVLLVFFIVISGYIDETWIECLLRFA